MLRKISMFIAVLSAYLLVLGHDLVPHHHHDERAEAIAHQQHDAEAAEAHHHHEHESENTADHSPLPEFFSHFIHAVYYPVSGNGSVETSVQVKALPCPAITHDVMRPAAFTIPIAHHPPDDHPIRQEFLSASRSLRAPPVC
jgi:hypothetical protein